MTKGILGAAALLALAACGRQDAEPTAEPSAGVADAGPAAPAAFAPCAACHVVRKGAPNGLGPNLWGVYGAKAGAVAGYNYSPAMKASGLLWDDAALNAYLENPRKAVPGTKMSYAGMADPAKRAEVIAYLKASK
jgi:cytochrome c